MTIIIFYKQPEPGATSNVKRYPNVTAFEKYRGTSPLYIVFQVTPSLEGRAKIDMEKVSTIQVVP